MIPLPQSPWTLAIAELLGMRLAALGSGAQPADVLTNLLPGGEPPPDGWLDRFVAGTPVAGWPPPVAGPSTANSPNMPTHAAAGVPGPTSRANAAALRRWAIEEAKKKMFADFCEHSQQVLATMERAQAESPAGLASDSSPSQATAPGVSQPAPSGWETVQQLLPGASQVAPIGNRVEMRAPAAPAGYSSSLRPTGDSSGQGPGSLGPALASSPAEGSVPPSPRPPRRQVRQDLRVQIDLQLDSRIFGDDVRKLAMRAAEQTIGRILSMRYGQMKGLGGCG